MIKSKLKEIMENKNITYSRLEALTGLSSQTITRARSDKIYECRLATLYTIARAIGVGTKDLYEETDE